MGPRLRHWLLLASALAFVAMGLVILASGRDAALGALCVLFFGACGAVAAAEIVRRGRAARQADDPELALDFAAGQVLRADARRIAATSAGLAVFGALLAALGQELGTVFVALCGLMALLGVGVLVALALGYTGRASLRFTAEALWVGDGAASYPVPWDSIVAVDLGEIHEQPVLRIAVADVEALLAGVRPRAAVRRVARAIGWNRGLYGADVAVMPRAFAVDEVLLLRAVERYARDPAARVELVEHEPFDGS